MNLAFTLQTVFEVFLFAAVVWGIFNEGKLVAFERRLLSNIRRRRLKLVSGTDCRIREEKARACNFE